jgi:pyruvate/2-oxoglutarate dehydrogenase complex dihydrolipoamide dehydrogenase (E3) component
MGAGAAGLGASYVAAAARARVTLITEGPMGGDCLNTGCVPSKALIASGKAAATARAAHRLGVSAAPQVDFPAVMARLRGVIEAIAPNDSEERYRGLGVEVIRGHARLIDPYTVAVNGTRLTTRAVVLATGAAPVIPPIAGIEGANPLTSETLWDHLAGLDTPPENLLVLGGGPIGCELAQALARLGAGVTLLESGPRLLPREEPEASDLVAASLQADGVRLILNRRAERFEAAQAVLDDGTRLGFGTLLVAVGRRARLQDLGLETLGIPADRVVETGAYLETLHPNIFAAGDLAGPAQLTNAAGHQGWIAAANALAAPFWRFRAGAAPIPSAVFTGPEVARVGLTVAEAAAQGLAVEVTRYPLADLDRAIAEGTTTGFVQILTTQGRDRIVGATVVGAQAGEIVAEFALAMRHGLGLNKILSTPHIYPSWSEAAKNAAGRWKQARVSPHLLDWAERFHEWRRG